MSLTLHASWTAEAESSTCRPVFLVTLWVASATSVKMQSGRSSTMSYPVSVQSITPINRSLDVWTRKLSTSSVTLVLRQDILTDDLVDTRGLVGTRCEIELGFADTAEANFAPYFVGVITDVLPSPLGVVLQLKDARAKMTQGSIVGSFENLHPVEAISQVATDSGLTSDMIDSTALTASTYSASISHWVIDRSGSDTEGDRAIIEPQPAQDVLDSLALTMDGTVWVNEEGKLTFSRFDSTAAAADAWTVRDLVGDPPLIVESMYSNIVNRIDVLSAPTKIELSSLLSNGFRAHYGYRVRWQEEDTDSQARFAYHHSGGSEDFIAQRTIDVPWVSGIAMCDMDNQAALSTFNVLGGPRAYAVCGTRFPGFPAGSQPADAGLSATRTIYVQVDEEIIECDQISILASDVRALLQMQPDNPSVQSIATLPQGYTLRVKTRGALGTSSVAHGSWSKPMLDITIPVALARARLARFANGAPVLRCRTSLAKYHLQIGDFVTLTVAANLFRNFGHSGLTSAVKWEITGKSCDLFSATPGIDWTLTYATETSPPATTYAQTTAWNRWSRDAMARARAALRAASDTAKSEVAQSVVATGFGLTLGGGLSVTIEAGAASNLQLRGELLDDYTRSVEASKETWISFDIENESVVYRAYTAPSTQPEVDVTEVMLYKVVAGAAAVTSSVDLRTINQAIEQASIGPGTIGPAKTSLVSEASIIPNGEFTAWSAPFDDNTAFYPDKWVGSSGAGWADTPPWQSALGGADTRFYFSSTSMTGDTSLQLEKNTTSDLIRITTEDYLIVSPGQLYVFEAQDYQEASSINLLQVEWYTTAKVYISTSSVACYGIAGWKKHRTYARAPSNAAYMLIRYANQGSNPVGPHLLDYIRCAKTNSSFFAYQSGAVLVPSGGAPGTIGWVQLPCGSEDHDYGGVYDGAGGTGFTAVDAGVWKFAARGYFNSVPAGDIVYLALYLGGAPGTGTQIASSHYYQPLSGTPIGIELASVSLRLAAAANVRVYLGWDDRGGAGGSLTCPGSSGPNGNYTCYTGGEEKKDF